MNYIEVIPAFNSVKKNAGCICMSWCTSDKIGRSVCAKKLEGDIGHDG